MVYKIINIIENDVIFLLITYDSYIIGIDFIYFIQINKTFKDFILKFSHHVHQNRHPQPLILNYILHFQ